MLLSSKNFFGDVEVKNIAKDIKDNNFKKVYLIYGEEKYLVSETKKNLLKALVNPGDNLNYSVFSGNGINEDEIVGICETMPFLAEHRVVLIQDSGWFKKALDRIPNYVDNIPDSTILIFVESLVDKRNKLYKRVKENGYVCECAIQNRSTLSTWVLQKLKKDDKKITKQNMDYLLDNLGSDMNSISCELEKLINYLGDRNVVEKENIDAVCHSEITGKIFEMVDAIGYKNQEKAMQMYYDLIATREAPMKILYMLTRQFNILYQIKELDNQRMSLSEIANRTKLQSFIVKKSLGQCENFSLGTLKRAVSNCTSLEEAIKTGNINDKMAVELIIIKYSQRS